MTDPIKAISGAYLSCAYGHNRDDALEIVKALDGAGWAVVPKEATEAMLRDGATWGTMYLDGMLGRNFAPLWHDMVAAGRVKP